MIKRQLHESDSLQAIQKMDFQSRLRELTFKQKQHLANAATSGSTAASSQLAAFQFNDAHVPIVAVNAKLDLFDSFVLSHHQTPLIKPSSSSQLSPNLILPSPTATTTAH